MTAVHDRAPSDPPASDDSPRSILRVAFQGELGAYGDQAITQHRGGKAAAVPSASFEHVGADGAWWRCLYLRRPVWNTVVGDISPGRDAVRLARRHSSSIELAAAHAPELLRW